MIRLVVLALIVVVAWFVLAKAFRELCGAKIDWTGVAFFAGFVVIAFWLRHVTGMG